jgi:hypothetical protein
MKHMLVIIISIVALLFTVNSIYPTEVNGDIPGIHDIDTNIKMAAKYLLDRQPDPGKECKDGIFFLIDAIRLTLPEAGYSKEIIEKMTTVGQSFKKNGPFEQEGIRLLHEVYGAINDGNAFQMPALSSIDEAVDYGKKMLEKARARLEEKDYKLTAKTLLETTLMVLTPMTKEE